MPTLGVCSWSLHPSSPAELLQRVQSTGLTSVQLALTPLVESADWDEYDTAACLRDSGITIRSGMLATLNEDYSTLQTIRDTGGVRPDALWPANVNRARAVALCAHRLGLTLVTFHAGFLPHDPADPLYDLMIDRLRTMAAIFGERGLHVAYETGQESGPTLVQVLRDLNAPNVGVNFDPANMILYGMGDPIAALRDLTPWVKQVHIKDALPTATPGTWGREVAVGTGAVDWDAFFAILRQDLPTVDCLIEREAGEKRVDDIKAAAALVRSKHPAIKG